MNRLKLLLLAGAFVVTSCGGSGPEDTTPEDTTPVDTTAMDSPDIAPTVSATALPADTLNRVQVRVNQSGQGAPFYVDLGETRLGANGETIETPIAVVSEWGTPISVQLAPTLDYLLSADGGAALTIGEVSEAVFLGPEEEAPSVLVLTPENGLSAGTWTLDLEITFRRDDNGTGRERSASYVVLVKILSQDRALEITPFCGEAMRIFGPAQGGGEAGFMKRQMSEVRDAMRSLPADDRSRLLAEIEALERTLDELATGGSPQGYSTGEVVRIVIDICGLEDLTSVAVIS